MPVPFPDLPLSAQDVKKGRGDATQAPGVGHSGHFMGSRDGLEKGELLGQVVASIWDPSLER